MRADLAIAAREQQPETQLTCDMMLRGGGREPPFCRGEIARHAKAGHVLVAQPRLRARVPGLSSGRVPERGLLRILAHRKSLRKQALQYRALSVTFQTGDG